MPGDHPTLGRLAALGCRELANKSDSPRLDAEVLLAHAAGVRRSTVLAYPERAVQPEIENRFRGLITQRTAGVPVAHIIGRKEFFSMDLIITADTLVPRPETELLVERALSLIPEDGESNVLDLCTGSGAVALAIKQQRPRARVSGVDISGKAVAVAERNAAEHGLAVRWIQSDLFSALGDESFNVIVSNPPYVPSGDPHFRGALRFEPRRALDGGPDGLDVIRIIAAGAHRHLTGGGYLLLEHAFDQGGAVASLLKSHSLEVIGEYQDLSHHPRVVVARAPARDSFAAP